ncbi:MAG TPA: hypothetical protein VND62_10655 [Acidimicrobiales bacterium]|nr:hypothetical protein [Acidimicrobiales bacterium]
MPHPAPDYRQEKSESAEGSGRAASRWTAFHSRLDEDVLAEAFPGRGYEAEELTDTVREDIAHAALEESELIGFWVAWHLAGGFANLERGGWHRATVFRKVRAFRSAFGAHPDDYRFPWITLDLEQAWQGQVERQIAYHRGELGY